MNIVTTLLHKFVSALASVDAIVGQMQDGIERLERASAAHEKQAAKLDAKISHLANLAADSMDEAARAKRVADRFRNLIG